MVRVNGKPCLDYIIDQATKHANLAEVIVVDGTLDDIRDYCKIKHHNITCVKQGSLDGPRDAISVGMQAIQDPSLPVVVWLGDAIILDENLPLGDDFLLCKDHADVENQSAWCVWSKTGFYDKPETFIEEAYALVGLYSFSDGEAAKDAFTIDDYNISGALRSYAGDTYNYFKRIITHQWYDIGNLPTYYRTCGELLGLKSRAFNKLEYNHETCTVTKSATTNHGKVILKNEIGWYDSLSPYQSLFCPRILPSDIPNQLIMSYEPGVLLSDLLLYDNLSESAWKHILSRLVAIKEAYFQTPMEFQELSEYDEFRTQRDIMWNKKVRSRLNETKLSSPHKKLLLRKAEEISEVALPIKVMHGDLHFGNILYSHQTDQFKFFDPRGEYGNTRTSMGDSAYDWCKLSHDVIHGYGALIANVPHNRMVEEMFKTVCEEYIPFDYDLVWWGGLILLATCIPLHYEDRDRQKRFQDYVEMKLEYVLHQMTLEEKRELDA
jgi:dTDP-glucose pyrophosphorylase